MFMKAKKKRLLLVYPRSVCGSYTRSERFPSLMPRAGYMNTGLATIAALTPPDFEVDIIDEDKEEIDFDRNYDIVGMTTYYSQIGRAKGIYEEAHKRGALVVTGGSGVYLSPDRWRPVSDVLIIGEAERIWPEFMEDYLNGDYKHEYIETDRPELDIVPLPDFSGFSKKTIRGFYGGLVQMSRGCPYNCEFCSAVVYAGNRMRYKPIPRIIEEVTQLKKLGMVYICFGDDNFSADRKKAKAILRALRDWNHSQRSTVPFFAQVSIDMAEDEELLELAAEAGLCRVLIGIESTNNESLKEVHKWHNAKTDMYEAVKRFSRHGITISGTAIVGFDHDDLSIFQQQFDFFSKAGIITPFTFPLQAHDGTRLKERIVKEGRYLEPPDTDDGWVSSLFDMFTVRPKQMTVNELRQGVHWLRWQLYKPMNLAQRYCQFLEDFENSPKSKTLKIPRPNVNWDGLKIAAGVMKYIFTSSPKDERTALLKMLRAARRSSHPQAFSLAFGKFILMKDVHGYVFSIDPNIENVPYPVRTEEAKRELEQYAKEEVVDLPVIEMPLPYQTAMKQASAPNRNGVQSSQLPVITK